MSNPSERMFAGNHHGNDVRFISKLEKHKQKNMCQGTYKSEEEISLGKLPLICHICEKSFMEKQLWRLHVKRHKADHKKYEELMKTEGQNKEESESMHSKISEYVDVRGHDERLVKAWEANTDVQVVAISTMPTTPVLATDPVFYPGNCSQDIPSYQHIFPSTPQSPSQLAQQARISASVTPINSAVISLLTPPRANPHISPTMSPRSHPTMTSLIMSTRDEKSCESWTIPTHIALPPGGNSLGVSTGTEVSPAGNSFVTLTDIVAPPGDTSVVKPNEAAVSPGGNSVVGSNLSNTEESPGGNIMNTPHTEMLPGGDTTIHTSAVDALMEDNRLDDSKGVIFTTQMMCPVPKCPTTSQFAMKVSLDSHWEEYHAKYPVCFVCHYCTKATQRAFTIKDHLKKAHLISEEEVGIKGAPPSLAHCTKQRVENIKWVDPQGIWIKPDFQKSTLKGELTNRKRKRQNQEDGKEMEDQNLNITEEGIQIDTVDEADDSLNNIWKSTIDIQTEHQSSFPTPGLKKVRLSLKKVGKTKSKPKATIPQVENSLSIIREDQQLSDDALSDQDISSELILHLAQPPTEQSPSETQSSGEIIRENAGEEDIGRIPLGSQKVHLVSLGHGLLSGRTMNIDRNVGRHKKWCRPKAAIEDKSQFFDDHDDNNSDDKSRFSVFYKKEKTSNAVPVEMLKLIASLRAELDKVKEVAVDTTARLSVLHTNQTYSAMLQCTSNNVTIQTSADASHSIQVHTSSGDAQQRQSQGSDRISEQCQDKVSESEFTKSQNSYEISQHYGRPSEGQPGKFQGRNGMNNSQENDSRYVCEICLMSYTFKSNLKRHVRKVHLNEDKEKDVLNTRSKVIRQKYIKQNNQQQQNNTAYKKIKFRKCSHCDHAFTSYTEYLVHLHKHAMSNLERAVSSHNCYVCGKKFGNKIKLSKHVQSHSKENKFQCCMCKTTVTFMDISPENQELIGNQKEFTCLSCKSMDNNADNGGVTETTSAVSEPLSQNSDVSLFDSQDTQSSMFSDTENDQMLQPEREEQNSQNCNKSEDETEKNLSRETTIHSSIKLNLKFFRCEICGRTMKYHNTLVSHMRSVH